MFVVFNIILIYEHVLASEGTVVYVIMSACMENKLVDLV